VHILVHLPRLSTALRPTGKSVRVSGKQYELFPGCEFIYALVYSNVIAVLYSRVCSLQSIISRNTARQVALPLAFPRTRSYWRGAETHLSVISFLQLRLCTLSDFVHSDFSSKTLYVFLICHTCCILNQSRPPLYRHPNNNLYDLHSVVFNNDVN
jgi:hypothetical protein